MNKAHNKNRIVLLVIFGMSVIPFLIVLFFGGKATFIKGRINNGELITPAVATELTDFIGIDQFSADNRKELRGHWVILNIVSKKTCGQPCLDAIYKTKQLHLMMNKDITRVRRAVLFTETVDSGSVNTWLREDRVLLRLKPSESLLKKLKAITRGEIKDGMLFLLDPLGNLMMQYQPGFDPYKVKSDLMHLLRVSQIG